MPCFQENLPDSGSFPPLTDLLGQLVDEGGCPYTIIAQGVRTREVWGVCLQEQLRSVQVDNYVLESRMTIGQGQGEMPRTTSGNTCSHLQKEGALGCNNGGTLDGSSEGVYLGLPCNPPRLWLTDGHQGRDSAL